MTALSEAAWSVAGLLRERVAGGSVFGGAVCFVVVTAEVVVSFVVTVVIDDAEDAVCGEVCDAVVLFTVADVVTEVVVV